jgi:hypothetical protein
MEDERKDDLKTTMTPEEILKKLKNNLPELKEVNVFGNKFTNNQIIIWSCIISIPIIILISLRKNELWSLLNIFWCFGLLYNQIRINYFYYLIYSNFGNIIFQILYILFYIWDIGILYQLEGISGKRMRNWSLLMEFILIFIELIILAFLLKNESLQRKNIEISDNIKEDIGSSGPYESPAGGLESVKKIPEEPHRLYPGDKKEKDRKQAIRRFEDEIEP